MEHLHTHLALCREGALATQDILWTLLRMLAKVVASYPWHCVLVVGIITMHVQMKRRMCVHGAALAAIQQQQQHITQELGKLQLQAPSMCLNIRCNGNVIDRDSATSMEDDRPLLSRTVSASSVLRLTPSDIIDTSVPSCHATGQDLVNFLRADGDLSPASASSSS